MTKFTKLLLVVALLLGAFLMTGASDAKACGFGYGGYYGGYGYGYGYGCYTPVYYPTYYYPTYRCYNYYPGFYGGW